MNNRLQLIAAHLGEHTFTALPVGTLPSYLALDKAGRPALAVPATSLGEPLVLETEMLTLSLFTRILVTELNGGQVTSNFHLLSCKSAEATVRGPFEALATGLAESLEDSGDADRQLFVAFETLRELFRTKPAADVARARIGLWGELFVMRQAGGYKTLAPFWHSDPSSKFDFSCGRYRLEIKATTSQDRCHSFSHGQLYTTGDTEVMVGSLVLRHEDAGLSLGDLIREARTALADDYLSSIKLETAVRLADMITEDGGPTFDPDEALSNIRFFRGHDIPHFPIAEPPGVTMTTYRVSMSSLPHSIPFEDLNGWLRESGLA